MTVAARGMLLELDSSDRCFTSQLHVKQVCITIRLLLLKLSQGHSCIPAAKELHLLHVSRSLHLCQGPEHFSLPSAAISFKG